MAYLINGDGFSPVTAQQDADLYAGILGQRLQVLDVGQKMAATIIDSNTIRIGDGEAVAQGRRIHNDPGQYDDFIIPNGQQRVTNHYIIGYRLYKNAGTSQEEAATFVQHVDSATDVIEEAVLRDGASESYISFYRVVQDGVSLTSVTPMFGTSPTLHALFDIFHPVGDIKLTVNNVNPGTYMPGTTWVAWGSGRVPVGVYTGDSNFNEVEKTGGANMHTHTNPNTNGTALTVNQIPAHSHTYVDDSNGTDLIKQGTGTAIVLVKGRGGSPESATSRTGGGQAHSHSQGATGAGSTLQPYITCYMWKRTA